MCMNLFTILEKISFEDAGKIQKMLLANGIYSLIVPDSYHDLQGWGDRAAIRVLKEDLNRIYPLLGDEYLESK